MGPLSRRIGRPESRSVDDDFFVSELGRVFTRAIAPDSDAWAGMGDGVFQAGDFERPFHFPTRHFVFHVRIRPLWFEVEFTRSARDQYLTATVDDLHLPRVRPGASSDREFI